MFRLTSQLSRKLEFRRSVALRGKTLVMGVLVMIVQLSSAICIIPMEHSVMTNMHNTFNS